MSIETIISLPEGTMAECVIEVVSYITREGRKGHALRVAGEGDTSTYIGILEMAKHELLVANDEGN